MNENKLDKASKIFSILASIMGVGWLLFRYSGVFPLWLICVVIAFIVIVLSWLFYAPVWNFLRNWIAERKYNNLARKFFVEFKEFADRLEEMLQSNRCDNIPYVLKDLRSEEGFKDISILPVHRLYRLFVPFKKLVKRFDGTKESLAILIELFDQMMEIYNEQYIRQPVDAIKRKGTPLPERLKEQYSNYRFAYMSFVEEYTKFGKKVNKVFGERICRTHYEAPREL